MSLNLMIKILLWILVVLLIFHFSIVLKIIPYDITWGGRLKNDSEMYAFEGVSIFINLFLLFILLIKGRLIKEIIPMKIVNVFLWGFMVLFGLNTIGNIFANSSLEKAFSLLTLTFVILIFMIMKKSKKEV